MEINGLGGDLNAQHYHDVPIERTLDWGDPEVARIIRIRYVGDRWSWPLDLSYAHGETATGERVWLSGLPDPVTSGKQLKRQLYAAATAAGVRLNDKCGGHLTDVLSVLV